MALPLKYIPAGEAKLPYILSANDSVVAGVVDPPYLIALKQMPYMQLTRLLDQLTDFSHFANDLFLNLANESIRVSERVSSLSGRLDELITRIPEFEKQVVESGANPTGRERSGWKSNFLVTSNLFTKSSRPSEISALYESCYPSPRLEVLDQFRNDGLCSMKLFSYPEFFVDEWKHLLKQSGDKHKKKKDVELAVKEDRGQVESNTPSAPILLATTKKQARERKRVDETPSGTGSAANLSVAAPPLKLPPPKAAPPPPPPPPPMSMNIPTTPAAGKPDLVLSPALQKPQGPAPSAQPKRPESSADMSGFLSDIKGRQFQLKKTEIMTREERKKQNEPDEVVAILMRRAALEASDSEEGRQQSANHRL
ncbi:Wiskott-Aldrich syndrome protein member 1 [Kappamyces sp. JEL0829]|nr:Wiskott-Aldrich syndrome protein member 1 [Kappamyces sp. JEL0829]